MSKNKKLIIKPKPIIDQNNFQKRYCILERYNFDSLESSEELFYEVPLGIELAEFSDCDNYLIAIIFEAMTEKRDIIVEGSVSKQLLINIREYIECWVKWLPDSLSIINIKAKDIRINKTINENCICAYSGGVDASFSVWKSYKNQERFDTYTIKSCAFIHGMDIYLDDQKSFDKAFATAQQTLAELNIDLIPIKTNFRQLMKANWEYNHACAMISSLSVLKKNLGICILGSSEPYDQLVIPWGSNPITDHLLSSDDFKVVHDGAAYNRIEKSEYILDWEKGVRNLRVCWEGNHQGANCGLCEKCLRTKLIFTALKSNFMPDFYSNLKLARNIKTININSVAQIGEWKSVLRYAELNKSLDAKVIKQIKRKMRKPIDKVIFPVNSRSRLLLKWILHKK